MFETGDRVMFTAQRGTRFDLWNTEGVIMQSLPGDFFQYRLILRMRTVPQRRGWGVMESQIELVEDVTDIGE